MNCSCLIFLFLMTPFFFLEQNAIKINLNCKRYGANKWMYKELDDTDLLYEIGILSFCEEIEHCQVCRKLLEWCIQILSERWNYIKYIDFYEALKVLRENKELFSKDIIIGFWGKNEAKVKMMINQYKITEDVLGTIKSYEELFIILNTDIEILKIYIELLVLR